MTRLRSIGARLGLALIALCPIWAKAEAAPPPSRVVSLNLCTDQLAMLLSGPEQLLSVSFLAADPRASSMVDEAARYRLNFGQAEEIAFLRPDLVLAGRYTARVTVDMLQRLGMQVEIFEPENTLDDIRANLVRMGGLLDRKEAAAALLAQMEAEIAHLAALPPTGVEAAVYYAGGFASGRGGLSEAILSAAQIENIAPKIGLPHGGVLPLEALILAKPAAIIRAQSWEKHTRATEMLGHPALRAFLAADRMALQTGPEWTCGTPLTIGAIARLSASVRTYPK